MSVSFMFDKAPPMWRVAPDGAGGQSTAGAGPASPHAILLLGRKGVAIGEIVDFDVEVEEARDNAGLMIAGALFLVIAMLFAFVVFQLGWQERFLIGTAFCGFFGLVSYYEASRIAPVTWYRVRVYTADGASAPFATADPVDLGRLLDVLEDAVDLNEGS